MLPLAISQTLFATIVGVGIAGAVVVSVIIIAYTIKEFRAKEIW